jgi:hypothetical protein
MTKIKLSMLRNGESVLVKEGDQSPLTPIPVVGKPFIISTYRTSLVQKILSPNTFQALNSVYAWEII